MAAKSRAGKPVGPGAYHLERVLRQRLRIVRVVPDIAGIEGEFDYLVPERFDTQVRVGTIVRVTLNGRRVRAWVVAEDVTPPEGKKLLEIQKVTGWGPPQELIDLAGWAAHRWIGKRAFHLQTASPQHVVSQLPSSPSRRRDAGALPELPGLPGLLGEPVTLLRLPPAHSPLDIVLACEQAGPILLITPSQQSAAGWLRRLRAERRNVAAYPDEWAKAASGGVSVVGTRAAAWAPMPDLVAIVVVDAHDRALQSESSPTWNAVDVAVERSLRRNVPLLAISAAPRMTHLGRMHLATVGRDEERAGWAPVHVVDLRNTDPRSGMYTDTLVSLLRSDKRVLCILNRKGRSQLLVCASCDEIARCEQCGSAQQLSGEATLSCRRCRATQPVVCRHCGGSKFKQLRIGVSKVRDELETLAGRVVGDVTSDSAEIPHADVLVGTEALLYRAGKADAVVFLDFDQDLLAQRISATEDALILLARAARIVGGRKSGGVVVVQTRQPEHCVINAAVHADPTRVAEIELPRRQAMGWPPSRAMAQISGPEESVGEFVARLAVNVETLGPIDGKWLVLAPNHELLADALWAAKPSKNVRIEIDPPSA